MTHRRFFVRKVIYFLAIAVLLIPLSYLSQPAVTATGDSPGSQGGKLARLRKEQNLSQANLGAIDPTSTTMKLALFGMHGIAANLLWTKTIRAEERGDFSTFEASLEQITHLQPHFVKVWDYQAHNVAFNNSVKFDDYRDRYRYVIKGFRLLQRGIRYNEKEPRIVTDMGQYVGFKIGKSDERELYRVLFREDTSYHNPPPQDDPLFGTRYYSRRKEVPEADNWLVSKWWYRQAEKLVDMENISYRGILHYNLDPNIEAVAKRYGPSPFVFHANPPRRQMNYAGALEEEGHFRRGQEAWAKAAKEWLDYSERPLLSTRGFRVRMGEEQRYRNQARRIWFQLVDLEPDALDRLIAERMSHLSREALAVLEKKIRFRTVNEQKILTDAIRRLVPLAQDLAEMTSEKNRAAAVQLAERFDRAHERAEMIESYKGAINFSSWRTRCEVERNPTLVAARRAIFNGHLAYEEADLRQALSLYEEGIANWKQILDEFPVLLDEPSMISELKALIDDYRRILQQNSEPFPAPFVLQEVLDRYAEGQKAGTVW